jgi:hypothetical protein
VSGVPKGGYATEGICSNCQLYPGTIRWGDHRRHTLRCERCVYGPQLRHALGRAIHIPVLALRLAWTVIKEA